jgi:adenylate cyclase
MTDKKQLAEIELEFTYLASALPAEIHSVTPKRLVDVYVPEGVVDHPVLRIRQRGDVLELTKKVPINAGDFSAHYEMTVSLNRPEYDALNTVSKRRIVKDRYKVMIDGFPAEVDVFQDELKGLVLIDFEFSGKQEQETFVVPSICLADVTQEEFLAGGLLSGKKYADIAKKLEKYNYRPIL